MHLRFFGATGTVTGSKYLVSDSHTRVLVDCGLFQGFKQLRLRNWNPLPFEPSRIDAVVLTHAHLDHSGYLPLLVKNGFRGPIYCTGPTRDLCGILLPDSGRIQEEDAAFANRRGFSQHHPARPLYTEQEARDSLQQLVPTELHRAVKIGPKLHFELGHSGHILGSAFVRITDSRRSVLFSGDLGRPQDSMMSPPETGQAASYLVIESTYGDRCHPDDDPAEALARIVVDTFDRGGSVLIPSFAVGRAQSVLRLLSLLRRQNRIPRAPIFLDSPMAIEATRILRSHPAAHRLSPEECEETCAIAEMVSTPEESRRVVERSGPKIVIAASGMATGGRVLHHLKVVAPGERNSIVFTGFQAGGTRGAALLEGAAMVKIHGAFYPIRAERHLLAGLSAHADQKELLDWMRGLAVAPQRCFVTHGEPAPADALRRCIQDELGWDAYVPEYQERVLLR